MSVYFQPDPMTTSSTQAAKQLLRREIKNKVAQLSDTEKQRQSDVVTQLFLSRREYQSSKRIAIFLSMPDEIRTEGIMKHILESGRECFIPRYIGKSMDMLKLHSWQDYFSLTETAWKIKQPLEDESRENALDTGGLDLIVMPGLAFSEKGDRLGRGKGYYDTYLNRCFQANILPKLLAVAYSQQICEHIPTTDHDIPVDNVLYEKN